MHQGSATPEEIYRFIFGEIDTVPHLEALLLLWNSRPKKWSEEELSQRLFITASAVAEVMQDLVRRNLIAAETSSRQYWYEFRSEEKERLIEGTARAYQSELIRISTLIHSKASSAVREFARAFKITKQKE